MSSTDPAGPDPGNAGPEAWAVPLDEAELADVLARVDNPDPLVTAGLAGTLYDPDYTGPGDPGDLDQEGATDGDH
jgi:hypothetical protein